MAAPQTPYSKQACTQCGETDPTKRYPTSSWCKACHKQAVYDRRLRLVGITQEQRDALERLQEGRCAICKRPESLFVRKMHMDHNHQSNQPRGLLCARCNQLLGRVEEDASVLRAAADYLEQWKG